MGQNNYNIKHIAVINLGYIGDIINTSPVCAQIKKNYPNAKLTFITIKPSLETAKNIPGIDNVLLYDRRGIHKGFLKLVKLAASYRSEKFDLVIILDNNLRSAFFAYLLGAKYRAGRTGECRSFFLTHKIPHLKEEKEMKIHVSEHYMRILKPLKIYTSSYDLSFNYSKEDEAYMNSVLTELNPDNKKIIGICTCTRNLDKNWNPEQAAEFIELVNKNTDYTVVFVGDESATNFTEKIKSFGITEFIDLTGKTSITQLGALIARFEKFISVDTGSMHLAFALKVPTICLFFFDIYNKWGPKNLDKNKIIYSSDKEGISAMQVFEKLNQL